MASGQEGPVKYGSKTLAFQAPPQAQHWQSIRTSNPIESPFATIRHRTKRTKGCLSRDGMVQMMFKLGQCAGKSGRKLRGFAHLINVIKDVDAPPGAAMLAHAIPLRSRP